MTAKPIYESEWLAELERLQGQADSDGMSSYELTEIWGCSNRTARERIKKLIELGRVAVGRRRTVSIDGRKTFSPVYKIKPKG